jgi:hypothetical protein
MWRRALVSLALWAAGGIACAGVEARMVLGTLPLAGFQYHAGKRLWRELKVGDALTLVREADNPYDPRAVRVEWRGEKLGYVPRAGNEAVAKLLDRGVSLSGRITHLQAGRSHWQRILFEVNLDQ